MKYCLTSVWRWPWVFSPPAGRSALFIMPEFPGGDYITAVAIGIVSGLAATGANQIGKQLFNK